MIDLFTPRLGLLAMLCVAPTAFAAPVTFDINPTGDSLVSEEAPTDTHGTLGALAISAPGSAEGAFQTVMKFDLASTVAAFDAQFGAGNWQVQSVTLRLTSANPLNPRFNANVAGQFEIRWMDEDAWDPATVTWNALPALLSGSDESLGTFDYDGSSSGPRTYTLAMPLAFLNDIQAGGELSLHLLAADADVSYLFNSINVGLAANRPVLSITAVPEPSSLALLGLAALAALRRR